MIPDEKLSNLPLKSGVYIFRDELGRVIYVGKAYMIRLSAQQVKHVR